MTQTISFPSHSHPYNPNSPQFSIWYFTDALLPKNLLAEDHSGSPKSGLQKIRTIAFSPNITFPKNPDFRVKQIWIAKFQGFTWKLSFKIFLFIFCLSDPFLKRRFSNKNIFYHEIWWNMMKYDEIFKDSSAYPKHISKAHHISLAHICSNFGLCSFDKQYFSKNSILLQNFLKNHYTSESGN